MPAHRLTLRACLLAAVAALTASPAAAVTCGLDRVPGATLLLPYFEVDTADPNGVATLLSINNADQTGTLVQVNLWSDLAVPVITFNVYLSGYDVQTINLRDIVVNAAFPATSPPASYLSCQGIPPPPCPSPLPLLPPIYPPLVPYLRDALTGQTVVFPSIGNPVHLGVDHGDLVARGFVTVDTVNCCGAQYPEFVSSPGYWTTGGIGIGSNRNILWGDYFYVDPGNDFAQGFNLVQLEADGALSAFDYTFYRKWSGGSDQREPLATHHAARFVSGGAFSGGTEIYYWRDPKRTIVPFTPGTLPAPYPLGRTEVLIFDEAENVTTSLANPFPYAAGKVAVGTDLPVPYPFGWIHVNLNTNVSGSQVPFDPVAQSTLAYTFRAFGRFSIGVDATALESACNLSTGTLPLPPLP